MRRDSGAAGGQIDPRWGGGGGGGGVGERNPPVGAPSGIFPVMSQIDRE